MRSLFVIIGAIAVLLARGPLFAAPPANEPIVLPGGTTLVDVDFERHVASLLGRLGCNSAACHGAFQGKGGFHLSLFGQSPAQDFAAIVGKPGASRVDVESPDDSLLLLKPSGQVPHGGGVRLKEGSWEYQLIRAWIAAGARRIPGSSAVARLIVEPAEPPPLALHANTSLRVLAHFADGHKTDVTPFSEFHSRDDAIAECDAAGTVTARNCGDTSIVVAYRGAFTGVPVLVPYAPSRAPGTTTGTANLIDDEVNARLDRLGLTVSPPAGDAEFLRRATLDVLGNLPGADDVRRFVADADPAKRAKLIDRLLAHPRRAALWATRMCDITACNVEALGTPEELRPRWAKMWHDWFRRRFEQNCRYDQIVRGVLCATSRDGKPLDAWIDEAISLHRTAQAGFDSDYRDRASLDLFWRRLGPQGEVPVEDLAELTASAFLGLRLHCARCHQHPYDRWTQTDFAGYANIFARVEFGSSTELRVAMNDRLEQHRRARAAGQTPVDLPRLSEVFVNLLGRRLEDSDVGVAVAPKPPGGPVQEDQGDPRETFFRWLVAPDNPYFAVNFVNRLWARYFGAGLVEPVDAFSAGNPATHPRLLERLAAEFVQSGYDIVHIERLILSSQAYERSSAPAGNNAGDKHNVARGPVRPLMVEVLLDAINAALESSDDFGPDAPPGTQAVELAPNRFSTRALNELFQTLGRGDRKSLCDCDRTTAPSLRQPLFLMSDPRVVEKLGAGRLSRLLHQERSDRDIIDEFYLATLSRFPAPDERDFALRHIAEHGDRRASLTDLVWGLINTREFSTNH